MGSVWDMTVGSFREAAASRSAPGCGAVAAASADFGLALVLKGLNIAETRHPDGVRRRLIVRISALLEALGGLADQDVSAFTAYLEALHLSKNSQAEENQRKLAISEAALAANEVPLAIAEVCREALVLTTEALPLTAGNLRSDVIGGGLLVHAGLSAVLLSVDANLHSVADANLRSSEAARRKDLQRAGDEKVQWLAAQGS